jgi:peptidoglycan/xylan/chitin deacetylase (PgdA/CDA1 family)
MLTIKKIIKNALIEIDVLGSTIFGYSKNTHSIVLCLHSIAKGRKNIDKYIDPGQVIQVESLRKAIEILLENGYVPADPDKVTQEEKKTFLITFDDGYYNNVNVLDLCEEYKIPIIVFVSMDYIINRKAFWWDICYRERISLTGMSLKNYQEIDNLFYQSDRFYSPISDYDRPFFPDELRDFSRNQYVNIGNHTYNHVDLTTCTKQQIKEQFSKCEDAIKNIVGLNSHSFAYPYGSYNKTCVNTLGEIGGVKQAFTVGHKKITNLSNPLEISRYFLIDHNIEKGMKIILSKYSLSESISKSG